jgi:hypothetical protein
MHIYTVSLIVNGRTDEHTSIAYCESQAIAWAVKYFTGAVSTVDKIVSVRVD